MDTRQSPLGQDMVMAALLFSEIQVGPQGRDASPFINFSRTAPYVYDTQLKDLWERGGV